MIVRMRRAECSQSKVVPRFRRPYNTVLYYKDFFYVNEDDEGRIA